MNSSFALFSAFLAAAPVAARSAETMPDPPGCASFQTDKTGKDADCDAAIAKETDAKTKSVLLQRRAYMEDAALAYALDPGNPERQFNLGSQLVAASHNREAIQYLDMALKSNQSHFAYSERAAVKLNLGDIDGAFFDAKTSFEIEPDELALTVLGDCLHAKTQSYDKAKTYWIVAYHLGDRSDRLIARLKDAGVPIPPPDDPKENATAN